jgi:sodium transport system permease protein
VRWDDIWILYRRELRSALRERSLVINSILMPVFLYPLLIWAEMTGIAFVLGLAEGFTSRVAVYDVPAAHAELQDTLGARSDVEIQDDLPVRDSALARVRRGDLDALVEFLPPGDGAEALPNNFRVRVRYDRSVERSRRARTRIEDAVGDYRTRWLAREADALGIAEADREVFRVAGANVSSQRDMGTMLLGMMIPLFLVISVALGCLVPAIDSTAGERERNTWETLLTVSASRQSMVIAKYLYVATVGALAGMLNVTAMFAAMGPIMRPLLELEAEAAFSFSFSVQAVAVMLAGAVALALFFAAAMMILAAFARSFKDGQAMVTPVFYLALFPLLLGQQTDQTLTPVIAAVPVANVAMMVRDAINGVFLWPLIAETFVVGFVMVAICLVVARMVLGFEDFLLGSHDGSFWRFARARLLGRGRKPRKHAA